MSDLVFQITQLDRDLGCSVGRFIFVVGDEPNYFNILRKIVQDKKIAGTLSLCRRVFRD